MRQDIDTLRFIPTGSDEPMTWAVSLMKNYTDGILVMHKGKIVYERYFGALAEDEVHAAMSVTKSFVGTLAAMLVFEGKLDTAKLVIEYIPELKESAFADATIREVMDMTTGLKFSEDYADPAAEIWGFSTAGNPLPKPKEYKGPRTYYEYLQTVQKKGTHGHAFGYKTVNTEVLGWIIARVSGMSVAELLSERVWRRLGMEQSAYFTVDGIGTPFAGGGLNAGLRDMARFGEMIRNNGYFKTEKIIPEAAVHDIRRGGDKSAFEKSGYKLNGWSYRNMWWITHNEHGAFAARGVHGQTIYIDPVAEMVIVRFASHPVAANAANDAYSLPAYHALAKHLIRHGSDK
jgi:CubicO group peptidase (beta-lactamase class C family)